MLPSRGCGVTADIRAKLRSMSSACPCSIPSTRPARAPWVRFTIAGRFDKWDGNLTFRSPDETTGVLEVKIESSSVDTGSGMKNSKLKGKDFFDVEQNPYITFRSTKFVPTGPHTYEVDGDFTIRGVSNPEKLTLTVSGKGT
jgi:polyisoprenoid-binding protein YceI